MATTNTNTLNRNVSSDDLESILCKIEYVHAIVGLITEQSDYGQLPSHQQVAIQALSNFTFDAKNAILKLID
ncbi:hypothetical protein [Yersinia pestis]|uniref:Uncharacterized protein n=1 Tax=Yersinia pestis subsp. pestis bv. Medievalis TaxID=1234662 RepID=A0A096ZX87_YERPE|nr:hypothetical protein [Yersinia pestis]AIS36182.1 hypothetical protein [Yersinia pestis subsp. pestis bv. Medievalis]KAA5809386.1 hypothetical protein F1600_20145 [Yersinia pestis]NSL64643.1 hypothetical protein [Yersinia pestis]QFR87658.1 hypothetical protein DJY80_22685 [Yersinia pestis subsp. pestis bv. Medievalis]TNV44389.1 hypothetical protein FIN95_19525 [Yersinia pestis]